MGDSVGGKRRKEIGVEASRRKRERGRGKENRGRGEVSGMKGGRGEEK